MAILMLLAQDLFWFERQGSHCSMELMSQGGWHLIHLLIGENE